MVEAILKKSPQWGLNLSDELCFWCDAKTGRKVIHGHRANDEKAPDSHFRDYSPCKQCEGAMIKGITLIQTSEEVNDNLQLVDGSYPTGVWLVMPEGWVRSVFKPEIADKIIQDKAVNLSMSLWATLNLPTIETTPAIINNLEFVETRFVETK